jgi:hypothetical protein
MKTVAGLVVVALVWGVGAAEKADAWNFEADGVGEVAKGFSNESGQWKVVQDDSAPSTPHVLAQTASDGKTPFNVTLATDTSYQDLDLSVKMKDIAGDEDQGGGLVWRAKDARNYYVVRFNPLEDNFRVYAVVNGSRKELGSADFKATPGWHALRVVMVGDHVECYLDGEKKLDVKDSTFKDAGKIGLWSKADAQSHFDDLTVKASH